MAKKRSMLFLTYHFVNSLKNSLYYSFSLLIFSTFLLFWNFWNFFPINRLSFKNNIYYFLEVKWMIEREEYLEEL